MVIDTFILNMSENQIKSFIDALWKDQALQDQFKAAGDSVVEIIAIASAAGFSISADDLSPNKKIEISEQELEAMAGGMITKGCCPWPDSFMSHCGG